MAKIKRKKVTIYAPHYNFDQRYEEAMEEFDDVEVISIHVLNVNVREYDSSEQYLVFYREIELVETDED